MGILQAFQLEGKVALVTGAARGLGQAMAVGLAEAGANLLVLDRDSCVESIEMIGEVGQKAHEIQVDVSAMNAERADEIVAKCTESMGRLDILVNCAGIFSDPYDPADSAAASVFKADIATIRSSLETNTYGALRAAQLLIPLMKGRGNVVNVSSGMGQLSDMNGCCPAYRLSKTAMNAVTRIFADELKETKININSVCPGWVRTDMGGPNAERTVAEGAEGIVWAACLSKDGPSGGFFRDGQPIPW